MVISGYALATSLFAARARFVPIFAVCAFALSGCVFPDSNSSDGSLASSWVRPNDPQEQLGAKEHPVVLAKYGGEYQNEQAERLIAVIVGKLVAVSDDPSRVYKITILNSPKVNAFALPGGFLYVTRGLLALASDSSELAAVIAHEMAHVAAWDDLWLRIQAGLRIVYFFNPLVQRLQLVLTMLKLRNINGTTPVISGV